ncbi:MAG TPA: SDR family oxidoreductase [Gemmataceae bacterium]|jgi:dTDP-4-dehydrorhamnose reductase
MRLLLTGASGQLGGYLLRECRAWGGDVVAWSGHRRGELFGYPLRPVDLADTDAVATAFSEARPDVVVHGGALATVSACQREPARAEQINAHGSAVLAELAQRAKVRLLHISTDMVFDGERGGYREDDEVRPLSVYGRTKAAGERAVLAGPRNLVVRVSLLFGPTLIGRPSFFDEQVSALREGRPIPLFHDEWRTPLSLLVAARGLLALAASDAVGLIHLGGPQRLSRLEMGQRLAAFLHHDPAPIVSASRLSAPTAEPRPRDLSLDSSRWRCLAPEQSWPEWNDAHSELMLL